MGGGIEPTVGTSRGSDRDADGQPKSCAVGRIDWVLCEHAGGASGSWGIADGNRSSPTSEGAGGRSAGESGHPFRAGSGDGGTYPKRGAQPSVPSDVRMGKRA